ncbi:hypothetical protein C0991_012159 [Blastosporella zonata]|nr:hypothetical protein C0991_012159 [Blastosporella zonata]
MATPRLDAASASPMPAGVTDPNYKPPPGSLGNLTVPQLHALTKFKEELIAKNIFVEGRMDDALLLRFLRARNFDVAVAMKMMVDAEDWRKAFHVDEFVETFKSEDPKTVKRLYPQYYHKTDKEGRPLYIEQLGDLDIREDTMKEVPVESFLQRLVFEYERFTTYRLPACSKAVGHPVETSCTILDVKGVTLWKFTQVQNYVKEASLIGKDRYPECMGKFYIINAPAAFTWVWMAVKLFLDPVTVKKVTILGSKYADTLRDQIPVENLPKEFGGTCACAGGCSLSDAGPWNEAAT